MCRGVGCRGVWVCVCGCVCHMKLDATLYIQTVRFTIFLQLGTFRGVQYSASVVNLFNDQNLRPEADWHPKIPDVVYWGEYICLFV